MTITRSDRRHFAQLIGTCLDLSEVTQAASRLLPISTVALQLTSALARPDWSMKGIADIVSRDSGLTTRLLRLANSPNYASPTPATSAPDALLRVGPSVAVALAISESIRGPFQDDLPLFGLKNGMLWRHAVAAALSTEEACIACGKATLPESYAAALLHDVGMVALSRTTDEATLDELIERAGVLGVAPHEARTAVYDVCHAELGALLAHEWGLPTIIADAIRYHHAPLMAPDAQTRRLCLELRLADTVAEYACAGCDDLSPPAFNAALAGSLQISQTSFNALVQRVSERFDEVLELYG